MAANISTKHIVVGTAGHVDHGKTTLIRALTGLDPDRLKEEKQRGMTIDLGFAWVTLPSGGSVGIIDVPGHERFLKNMLAGAGGIDAVLLVIAADEGVMPQTVEHLEILELLETSRGVVALTKCDMVDEEWLEVVEDDIRERLKGTFLERAPIVRVSGTTSAGLPELIRTLDAMCEEVTQRAGSGPFRIPVDRVFTMTGFGAVITGTLVSGTIRTGDPLEILPTGLHSRVRQIEVHEHKQDEAVAGTRVAINLAGVETSQLSRGDVLASPGYLKPTRMIDAHVRLLENSPWPLRSRMRIRLHIGAAEMLGRVTVLDKDEIEPGGQGYIVFRSEEPLTAARGDRFVIRSYSPMLVIGGGSVIEPNAARHKRFDNSVVSALEAKRQGDPRDLVEQVLLADIAASAEDVAKSAALAGADAAAAIDGLVDDGRVLKLDSGRLIHAVTYSTLAERVVRALEGFHRTSPLKAGESKEELRAAVARGIDQKTFNSLLNSLQAESRIEVTQSLVKLAGHEMKLSPEQEKLAANLDSVYRQGKFNPPTTEEAATRLGRNVPEMVEFLASQGKLVKIDEGLYFHPEAIAAAEELIRQEITKNGPMTVSTFRDLTGSSRKYTVPLLGYFDDKRITRRMGDQRVLMK